MTHDWERLRAEAVAAMRAAYAPYSGYPVGAAAVTTDGRVFSGCNVENAAYGVTLCAECGLVSTMMREGGGRLAAFCCVNGDGDLITPCGRCRQLLWEHGGPELEVLAPGGVVPMSAVLPGAFDVNDMNALTTPPADTQSDARGAADAAPYSPADPTEGRTDD